MKLLEDLSSSDSGCSAACLASTATELLLARGDTVAATLLRWPATRSIRGRVAPRLGCTSRTRCCGSTSNVAATAGRAGGVVLRHEGDPLAVVGARRVVQ
jgi:hypothetical protein